MKQKPKNFPLKPKFLPSELHSALVSFIFSTAWLNSPSLLMITWHFSNQTANIAGKNLKSTLPQILPLNYKLLMFFTWKGLNNTAFYELKDNIRVLVSIDIKGILVKVPQGLDIAVIDVQALLNIFFLVLGVLPEPGLDLWSGSWSECGVVSAGEKKCHSFSSAWGHSSHLCRYSMLSPITVPWPLSAPGWGFKTKIGNLRADNLSFLPSRILDPQRPRVSLEGTLAVFICSTQGEISIALPSALGSEVFPDLSLGIFDSCL